jgi:predicted small lipoprotein YifL
MLRDFHAADRPSGGIARGTILLVALLAVCAAGCGIKGPLRPPPPPTAAPVPAAPDAAPAAPAEAAPATPPRKQ